MERKELWIRGKNNFLMLYFHATTTFYVTIILKYIQKCLTECISDENTVEKLMDYIKEKREVKYQNGIKRNYK